MDRVLQLPTKDIAFLSGKKPATVAKWRRNGIPRPTLENLAVLDARVPLEQRLRIEATIESAWTVNTEDSMLLRSLYELLDSPEYETATLRPQLLNLVEGMKDVFVDLREEIAKRRKTGRRP